MGRSLDRFSGIVVAAKGFAHPDDFDKGKSCGCLPKVRTFEQIIYGISFKRTLLKNGQFDQGYLIEISLKITRNFG